MKKSNIPQPKVFANKENVKPDSNGKIAELEEEIEKLKKEKKQKLVQFDTLDGLLKKAQQEAITYKNKYEQAQSEVSALSVKPEEKNRAEEIESLRVQLSHIEEQYKLKLGESKALESKVQQLEQSKASLESTVNAQSQQLSLARQQANENSNYQFQIEELQGTLETKESEFKEEFQKLQDGLKAKDEAIESLTDQLNKKKIEYEQQGAKLKTLAVRYTREKEQWDSQNKFDDERIKLEASIDEHKHIICSLQSDVENLKNQLNMKSGECDLLLEELREAKKLASNNDLTSQLEQLKFQLEEQTIQSKQLEEDYQLKIKSFESKVEQLEQDSIKLNELSEQKNSRISELELENKDIVLQLKDEIKEKSNQLAELESAHKIALEKLQEELGNKTTELARLETSFQESSKSIENVISSEEELKKTVALLEAEVQNKTNEMEMISSTHNETMEQMKREIKERDVIVTKLTEEYENASQQIQQESIEKSEQVARMEIELKSWELLISQLKDEIQTLRSQSQRVQELETQIITRDEEFEKMKQELEQSQLVCKQLNVQIENGNTQQSSIVELTEKITSIEYQHNSLQNEYQQYQEQQSKLNNEHDEIVNGLNNELVAAKSTQELLENQVKKQTEANESNESTIQELKEKIEVLLDELKCSKDENETMTTQYDEMTVAIDDLNYQMEQMKKTHGDDISELRNTHNKLYEEYEQYKQTSDQVESELRNAVDNKSQTINKLELEIMQINEKLSESNHTLEERQTENKNLVIEQDTLKEMINDIKNQNSELQTQYNNIKNELERIKEEYNEYKVTMTKEGEELVIELQQQLNQMQQNKTMLIDNINTLEREIQQSQLEKSSSFENEKLLKQQIEELEQEKITAIETATVSENSYKEKINKLQAEIDSSTEKLSLADNIITEYNNRFSEKEVEMKSMEQRLIKLAEEFEVKYKEQENLFSCGVSQLEVTKNDLEVARNMIIEKEQIIVNLQETLVSLQETVQYLTGQAQEYEHKLQENMDRENYLEDRLSTIASEFDDCKLSLEKSESSLVHFTHELHSEKQYLEDQIVDLKQQLVLVNEEKDILIEQLNETETHMEFHIKTVTALEDKIINLEETIEKNNKETEQPLQIESNDQVKELEIELNELKSTINSKDERLIQNGQVIEELKTQIETQRNTLYSEFEQVTDEHNSKVSCLREELTAVESAKQYLATQVQSLTDSVNQLHSQIEKVNKLNEELQINLEEYQQQINNLQEEKMKGTTLIEQKVEQQSESIESINNRIAIVEEERNMRVAQCEEYQTRLESLHDNLDNLHIQLQTLQQTNQVLSSSNEQMKFDLEQANNELEIIKLGNVSIDADLDNTDSVNLSELKLQLEVLMAQREELLYIEESLNDKIRIISKQKEEDSIQYQQQISLLEEEKSTLLIQIEDKSTQLEQSIQHKESIKLEFETHFNKTKDADVSVETELSELKSNYQFVSEENNVLKQSLVESSRLCEETKEHLKQLSECFEQYKNDTRQNAINGESDISKLIRTLEEKDLEITHIKQQLSVATEQISNFELSLNSIQERHTEKINELKEEYDNDKITINQQLEATLQELNSTKEQLEHYIKLSDQQREEIDKLEEEICVTKDTLKNEQLENRTLQSTRTNEDDLITQLQESHKVELSRVFVQLETQRESMFKLKDQLSSLTSENAMVKAEKITLTEQIEVLNNEMKEMKDECDTLRSSCEFAKEQHREIKNEFESAQQQWKVECTKLMREQEQYLEVATQRAQHIDDLQTQLQQSNDSRLESETQIKSLLETNNCLKNEVKETRESVNSIRQIEVTLKDMENKYEELTITNTSLNETIQSLEKQIEQSNLESETKMNTVKNQYEKEMNDLSEKLTETMFELTTLQQTSTSQIDDFKKTIESLKEKELLFTQLEKSYDESKQNYSQLETEYTSLQSTANELRDTIDSLKYQNEQKTSSLSELTTLKEQLNNKELEIKQLKEDALNNKVDSSIEVQLKAKEEEVDQFAIKYNTLIQENRKLTKKISTLEAKLAFAMKKSATQAQAQATIPTPSVPTTNALNPLLKGNTATTPSISNPLSSLNALQRAPANPNAVPSSLSKLAINPTAAKPPTAPLSSLSLLQKRPVEKTSGTNPLSALNPLSLPKRTATAESSKVSPPKKIKVTNQINDENAPPPSTVNNKREEDCNVQ